MVSLFVRHEQVRHGSNGLENARNAWIAVIKLKSEGLCGLRRIGPQLSRSIYRVLENTCLLAVGTILRATSVGCGGIGVGQSNSSIGRPATGELKPWFSSTYGQPRSVARTASDGDNVVRYRRRRRFRPMNPWLADPARYPCSRCRAPFSIRPARDAKEPCICPCRSYCHRHPPS